MRKRMKMNKNMSHRITVFDFSTLRRNKTEKRVTLKGSEVRKMCLCCGGVDTSSQVSDEKISNFISHLDIIDFWSTEHIEPSNKYDQLELADADYEKGWKLDVEIDGKRQKVSSLENLRLNSDIDITGSIRLAVEKLIS